MHFKVRLPKTNDRRGNPPCASLAPWVVHQKCKKAQGAPHHFIPDTPSFLHRGCTSFFYTPMVLLQYTPGSSLHLWCTIFDNLRCIKEDALAAHQAAHKTSPFYFCQKLCALKCTCTCRVNVFHTLNLKKSLLNSIGRVSVL